MQLLPAVDGMTGIATAIYESVEAPDPIAAAAERQREHIAHELRGVARLEGTYPFTLDRSVKAFRINEYLHRMIEPAHREAFRRDPEATSRRPGSAPRSAISFAGATGAASCITG